MENKTFSKYQVTDSEIKKDLESRAEKHPLTPYQSYMVDYQMYTPMSTMWNFSSLYKFDKSKYEPAKLAEAVKTAISAHPALATVIAFNDDGTMYQQYKPEIVDEVKIEETSEIEFAELKNGLVSPFKIANNRLYRAKIFVTEKAGYFFFDVHHVVFDSTSLKKLLSDVIDAYNGMAIDHDCYYLSLAENEAGIGTEAYESSKKYFENEYDDKSAYSRRPVFDDDSRENTLGEQSVRVNADSNALSLIEKNYGADAEAVFTLASMIAVGMYNEEPNVIISWLYSGRDNGAAKSSVGLLTSDLRLAVSMNKKAKMKDIYADIVSQMKCGIQNKQYPYSMTSANAAVNDVLRFIYLPESEIPDGAELERVEIKKNKAATENVIDIELCGSGDKRTAKLSYNASRYSDRSVRYFTDTYIAVTNAVYATASNDKATIYDVIKAAKKQLGEFSWYLAWLK